MGMATGTGVGYHNQTGTYNCLAFAVDITWKWQGPKDWKSRKKKKKMLRYMNGTESGNLDGLRRTTGTFYNNGKTTWTANTTKVICYQNNMGDYHFAKVVNYKENGEPFFVDTLY